MKKVLLLCDKPNWAYDAIAKALVKHNFHKDLQLDIAYVKSKEDIKGRAKTYDKVFVMGWQLIGELQRFWVKKTLTITDNSRIIVGVHSHHSWDDRLSMPDVLIEPPKRLIRFLKGYKLVNTVSNRLATLFRNAGLNDIVCTLNGVDVDIFKPENENFNTGDNFIIGYSGSEKHDWRKGITEYIVPACKKAGVQLKLVMPVEGQYVPLTEMPGFYNSIDAYLCASTSEGFSLSVLEAASCGLPVISTKVGGSEELIKDGVNGFLVDRTVDAMVEKLVLLKNNEDMVIEMGRRSREIVMESYSWEIRSKDWYNFILSSL
ncbi:MAG: glycosyltransferase family 4 protein [Nitrospirae bacterium]|nr:glycosyltransferase family 4 protein [Nitrospirota bacterium]MBF0541688.1 glycosyltransferase family 4 protein [Nitrospirota bacterium]